MRTSIFLFFALLSIAARSEIYIVPNDFETIQSAINAADNFDTILINQGTYIENLFIDKALTITSQYLFSNNMSDIENTIIDGDSVTSVVHLVDVTNGLVNILGLTITNGIGTMFQTEEAPMEFLHGGGLFINNCTNVVIKNSVVKGNYLLADHTNAGGIFCYNSNLMIDQCEIYDNEVHGFSFLGEGAGIQMMHSNVEIKNTAIYNNRSEGGYGLGGGIYSYNGNLTIENSTITSNINVESGGIHAWNTNLTINSSELSNNKSDFRTGGMIFISSDTSHSLNMNEVLFENNSTQNTGASLQLINAESTLSNIELVGNKGGYNGGGIYVGNSNVTLNSSTISKNTSHRGDAAGMEVYRSNVTCVNVEFKENICEGDLSFKEGGAIKAHSSNLTLDSVYFYGNQSDIGGAIYANTCNINLFRCVFYDNYAVEEGGGIFSYNVNMRLLQSTIINNASSQGNFIHSSRSNYQIVNSILWEHDFDAIYCSADDEPSVFLIAYTDFENLENAIQDNNHATIEWQGSNYDTNPNLEDIENFNFNLKEESALIDAGTAFFEFDDTVLIDYQTNEYSGIAPDIGAFEFSNSTTNILLNDSKKEFFSFYPNPFKESFSIEFHNEILNGSMFGVYTIEGKLIYGEKILNNKTSIKISSANFDIKSLKPQLLFLRLEQPDGRILVKKIIKY